MFEFDFDNLPQAVMDLKTGYIQRHGNDPMPAFVIVERAGTLRAIYSPENVDKIKALRIAQMCRRSYAADGLAIVIESYFGKDGEDPKWSEPGSMAEAFAKQHGPGEVGQAVTCLRIKDDKLRFLNMVFEIHNGTIRWSRIQDFNESNSDQISGYLAESLRKIMAEPPLIDEPVVQEAAVKFHVPNRDRQLWHCGHASRHVIESFGHRCLFEEARPAD